MEIQIIEQSNSYMDLLVGKTQYQVSVGFLGTDLSVHVICKNASNRVWRGLGNFFGSWEQALEHYKSTAAHIAINHAMETLTV